MRNNEQRQFSAHPLSRSEGGRGGGRRHRPLCELLNYINCGWSRTTRSIKCSILVTNEKHKSRPQPKRTIGRRGNQTVVCRAEQNALYSILMPLELRHQTPGHSVEDLSQLAPTCCKQFLLRRSRGYRPRYLLWYLRGRRHGQLDRCILGI